jgi:hypothetical protein
MYAAPIVLFRSVFLVLGDCRMAFRLGVLARCVTTVAHRFVAFRPALLMLRHVLLMLCVVFMPGGIIVAASDDHLRHARRGC